MAPTLVERFTQWAQGRDGIEPDVVETLTEFKRDFLGDAQAGRWRAGDLTAVLLDLVPAKVSADDAWYDSVVPTMQAFIRFAHSEGLLHRGSAPSSALLDELTDIEGDFADAVRDPSRFGLAKAVMSAIGDVDLTDPGAIQAAMEQFNALPEEERRAITDPAMERALGGGDARPDGPFGGFTSHIPGLDDDEDLDEDDGPPQLPMVRLAPVGELVEAARSCVAWQQVQTLTDWLGESRRITAKGVLRLPDARSACRRMGFRAVPDWANQPWLDRARLVEEGHTEADLPPLPEPPVRSAREIDALQRVWLLAQLGGWIEVDERLARRGPAWSAVQAGDEPTDLQLWTLLFTSALELGMGAADARRYPVTDDKPVAAVIHALMSSYVGERHTVGELLDEMLHAEEDLLGETSLEPETEQMLCRIEERRIRQHLSRLVDLGAITVDEDGAVTLTPLGVWGMNQQLESIGLLAPAFGDVTEMDARELLVRTECLSVEEAETIRAEWIGTRSHREAADAFLAAAREGSAMMRVAVMSVLEDDLDDVAIDAARPHLDHPTLGRHVRLLLIRHQELEESALTHEDRRWLAVESLAALLEDVEPPVHADDLLEEGWLVAEDALELSTAWKIDHPQLLMVLDAVASGHPRDGVRAAARKAARKARMSGRTG
jgi:hypothetical protein